MELNYGVDWFNYTLKDTKGARMGNVDNSHVEGKGMNGYTVSARYLDGRIENSNPNRPDMGTQIIMSGSTIANFQDMYNKTADEILAHYACFGGKCTRIDLAIDVHNSGLKFDQLCEAIENNEITTKTPRSKIHYHRSFSDDGWTIYVGKKSKHRFMRIYNKGVESGKGGDWIRFELQCNTKTAQRYHVGYVDAKDKGKYIKNVLNGFISFDNLEIWRKIVGDEKITMVAPQPDGSKTLDWIYKTVAPFMGRYIARYGSDILDRFMMIVEDERKKELNEIMGRD